MTFWYFLYLQHWNCLSKIFHHSVYCSFLEHYNVGHLYKTFNITFSYYAQFTQYLPTSTLFYKKYFEQILNCSVWETTGTECVRVQRWLALHKVVPIPRLLVKRLKLCRVYVWGLNTRWFKYDRDWFLCKQYKSVPVIFEPPCIILPFV